MICTLGLADGWNIWVYTWTERCHTVPEAFIKEKVKELDQATQPPPEDGKQVRGNIELSPKLRA